MSLSLQELFSHIGSYCHPQGRDDSFSLKTEGSFYTPSPSRLPEMQDMAFLCGYFSQSIDICAFNGQAGRFFDLSQKAFDILIHAWMSELPIEKEIVSFAGSVIAAGESEKDPQKKRKAVSLAVSDRGNAATLAVLNACQKVEHEYHRMIGLLRFSPLQDAYIAKCAPDHLILPSLGGHFNLRFGKTPWAIIDEKRMYCLKGLNSNTTAGIVKTETCGEESILSFLKSDKNEDKWEELWQHYHKTISNESRENLKLQRSLMPQRYWKYLNEVK